MLGISLSIIGTTTPRPAMETTGQAVESVILPVRGTISAEGRASFQVREFPGT